MAEKSVDDKMREDFALFMFMIWDCLGYEPHPVQTKTAKWLQEEGEYQASQDKEIRRALFAMRNFGKTLLIATLICWYFKRNPNATVLVQSATQQHSVKIVSFVKKLIETSPYLAEMRPKIEQVGEIRSQTLWGRLRLEVGNRTIADKDPSLAAYGAGSQITGSHVDHIICDDIETMENSRTVETREKIKEKIHEYEDVVNPKGTVDIIGTFQHTEAVLVDVVKTMGYSGIRIPSEYPDPLEEDDAELGAMWILAPWLIEDLERGTAQPGDATYPERWGLDKLMAIKEQSPSRYRLQRLLDPSMSDESRFPLKMRDLIIHTVDQEIGPRRVLWSNEVGLEGMPRVGIGNDKPYVHGYVGEEFAAYEQKVMWVDPAGVGENADEVGYCVAYILNGLIRVPAWGGLSGGYHESTLKKLADIADKHGVKTIWVEPDMGDGMFTHMLSGMVQDKLGLPIGVKNAEKAAKRGSKEPWICDTLEPILGSHRLILDPNVARNEESMYQLTHITRDRGCLRRDDRIDALAGACSLFQAQMFKDMDKAEDQRKLEIRKQDLKEWDREVKQMMRSSRQRKRRGGWLFK